MKLDDQHLHTLQDALALLKEAETRLAWILEDTPESTLDDFDEMCDTLSVAGARLRYVRVFLEKTPDEELEDDLDRTLNPDA